MRQERYYTPEERARIVAELMAPGADVHGLLKKHGLPRSTFYDWRRQYRIEHGQECPTECSRRNLRMLAKALERERTLREILMVATCAPGGTLGERLRRCLNWTAGMPSTPSVTRSESTAGHCGGGGERKTERPKIGTTQSLFLNSSVFLPSSISYIHYYFS